MPGRMAERIGDASGEQVGQYVMSRPEVQQAIAAVDNAARWVSTVAQKADRILRPFAELADKADGAGGLIRAILGAWQQVREQQQAAGG